jgi:ketosteroid isomerase-like protein
VKHSPADRLDVLELSALAYDAATRRDAAAYVACFTEDAVLDGGMGEHRGRAAMEGTVGPIWQAEGDASVHLTTIEVIEPDSSIDDGAVAHSVLVILGPRAGGRPQCLEHHPPSGVHETLRWR